MSDAQLKSTIEIGGINSTDPMFAAILRNIEEMNTKASVASDKLLGLGKSVEQLKAVGEGAKQVLELFGVALSLEAVMSFNEAVTHQAAALKDQADALGLTTDQLQAYQVAVRTAGGNNEIASRLLSTFNQAVGQAAQGDKAAAQAFIDLKVKILDANGAVRDNADILTEASQKLLAIENPGLRAAAAQALFGRESKTVTPYLREFAKGSDDLTDSAKAMNQVFSQEVSETLNRLENQSAATKTKIAVLWAQFAAPIQADGLGFVARQMKEIADSIALVNTHRGVLSQIMEVVNVMGLGGGSLISGQSAQERALKGISDAEAEVVKQRQKLEGMSAGGKSGTGLFGETLYWSDSDIAKQKESVASAEKNLSDAQRVYLTWQKTQAAKDAGTTEPVTVTGARYAQPKGDGGRDRIQESLNQVTLQAEAAQQAYDRLLALATDIPLKDAERVIDTQQKIADEFAKLGKYDKNDPRLAQLQQEVEIRERLNSAIAKRKEALAAADQIEKQTGDGTAYLRDEMDRLNQALDTGRLSYDAYAIAVRDARDKAEDMRLTNIGQQEGFQGLVAGMEYAAAQWERNNRSFQTGQKIFQNATQAMSQALGDLVTKGKIDFQSLLSSFISMIAQMEMQAAASQLFGKNGAGGLLGDLIGSIFGSGTTSLTTQANNNILSGAAGAGGAIGGFATGGDPPVGVPSWVGEQGPELFIPKTAGTIIPNDKIGGAGDSVVINQSMAFGSDVSRSELKTWAQQIKNDTMAAIVDDRRRGKSSKAAFTR